MSHPPPQQQSCESDLPPLKIWRAAAGPPLFPWNTQHVPNVLPHVQYARISLSGSRLILPTSALPYGMGVPPDTCALTAIMWGALYPSGFDMAAAHINSCYSPGPITAARDYLAAASAAPPTAVAAAAAASIHLFQDQSRGTRLEAWQLSLAIRLTLHHVLKLLPQDIS